ncbi:MAG TPA: efflux RND transporter permease subunit, partial [Vicinamibacterales bacterium]
MIPSEPFIRRPVATALLTAALALSGVLAFRLLPVSPLPQVDFPTIVVSTSLPGASPETMASGVATPLERQFERIAGVNEMTSSSRLGSTSVVLQFSLDRDINGAARDVQAAINASRGQLPPDLPGNPTYRKVNPADAPAMILSMTSDTIPRAGLYDFASSVVAQRLSQVPGVGQVNVGGGALPAVRVELNPQAVAKYGLGFDQVRSVLGVANANRPKGQVSDRTSTYEIGATDQLMKAAQYQPLIVAYRNGAPIRLSDIGDVVDSVQDTRVTGLTNGKPAVQLQVFRQTGANIIQTVDRVKALLPEFRALLPPAVDLAVAIDRTTTIRASVADVEWTLVVAILLVVLVVFVFLRSARTTIIPGVAVPLSLLGTFGAMYFLGYSLDNLSLMALTISTGFVVDDAIVVIENVNRHLAAGMEPLQAALVGAKEIGFTVVSMSASLIAVFIPILL